MSFKEVVTLQVGNYSNFVGTHWWNIQESSFIYDVSKQIGPREICHDVLFREGHNWRREVTFTPRLVAFDLKGSLRSLKQDGTLYENGHEGDEIRWLGDVTMHTEEPVPKNSFLKGLENNEDGNQDDNSDEEKSSESDTKQQKTEKAEVKSEGAEDSTTSDPNNLDNTVNGWSDFLHTHYHPKSIHIVEEYRQNDELRAFDLFNCADEFFSNYESTCEWEDRIHHFTEECDRLQGFQVLMDTHNGFGGLGAGLLRYLDDEYSGKGVMTFGFTPSDLPDNTAKARSERIINSALAYDKACEHSSLFVPASLAKGLWNKMESPLTFPNLSYQSIPYHTSAILASTLDTLSLPYRLDSNAIHMRDITHSLNAQSRKMASLNTSMPLGLYADESLIDYFSLHGNQFPWQSLTPHMTCDQIPLIQSVVMRGVTNKQVKTKTDLKNLPDHLSRSKTTEEVLQHYLANKCTGNLFATNCLEMPIKTATPYPLMFKDNVNKNGFLSSTQRPETQAVDSMPMLTSLQCNTAVGGVIEHLHDAAAKMNIKKHHRYLEMGLEEDDYEEVLHNLEGLASNYKTETQGL